MKTAVIDFYDSDQSFKRIAWACVVFYGVVAVSLNLIKIEKPERDDFSQMSPRIAQLIVEAQKPLPLPPPIEAKKEEKVKEEKKEEKPEPKPEKKAEPKVGEPKTAPRAAAKEEPAPPPQEAASEPGGGGGGGGGGGPEGGGPGPQAVAKQEGPTPDQIRVEQEVQRKRNVEVAMNSGLLRVLKQSAPSSRTQELANRKVFSEVKGLSNTPKQQPSGISPVAIDTPTTTRGIDDIVENLQKGLVDSRPVIPEKPITGSGGISSVLADARAGSGGGGGGTGTGKGTGTGAGTGSGTTLKEHKTASIESPFQVKGYEDGNLPRSLESIAEVVESYKGGTAFLYNKYLRENPTLRGTVTVEFTIAAAGEVLDCRVVSSTMKYTPFEEALMKRILQWKFPVIPAGNMTIIYPIVFTVTG